VERAGRRLARERCTQPSELREEPGYPPEGPDLRGLKGNHVDLLLLAGDLPRGITYAEVAASYLGCPSCVTIGNHEGYQGDLLSLVPALRDAAAGTRGRVRFLEKERGDFTIQGRRLAVLGAALWTDYRVNGDEQAAMIAAGQALTDHRLIRYGSHRFTPVQARAIHHDTRAWLRREVERARQEADVVVVVTHHDRFRMPTRHSTGAASSRPLSCRTRDRKSSNGSRAFGFGGTRTTRCGTGSATELVSAQRGYIGSEEGADSRPKFLAMVSFQLNRLGFYLSLPTDKPSDALRTAIDKFQHSLNAEPTGILTMGQWEELGKRTSYFWPQRITLGSKYVIVLDGLVSLKGTPRMRRRLHSSEAA
jgi:hypothetical protein